MSDIIKLTSDRGTLRISHGLPELKSALSFRHTYTEKGKEITFTDRHTGKKKTITKKGKIRTATEPLYAEGPDSCLYTHDGMLSTVANTLTKLGFVYEYERLPPAWPRPVLNPAVVRGLFPEQIVCLTRMLACVGGCMIQAATSAGKTRIILALIRAFPNKRIVIMTYRQSVVRGLIHNLQPFLEEEGIKVGICMSPNIQIERITVSTIGSSQYLDPRKVDILIGDEFHRFAADGASSAWLSFNRAWKVGLSATLTDRFDGKTKYLESLSGPLIFELTDQELEMAGRVPPLDVYFLSVPEGPDVDSKSEARAKKFGLWKNDVRNALIKQVLDLVPADQQVLVFVETLEHLNAIRNLVPDIEFCHGEMKTKEREAIEKRFTSGEAKRIVSTDCLSEGVDPRCLMVMIDASAIRGDSAMIQKRGRLRRPGKERGILIQFQDEWSTIFGKKALARIKEHKKRGDTVFENAAPEDIKFVNADSPGDENL